MYYLVRKCVYKKQKGKILLTIAPSNIVPYHFEEISYRDNEAIGIDEKKIALYEDVLSGNLQPYGKTDFREIYDRLMDLKAFVRHTDIRLDMRYGLSLQDALYHTIARWVTMFPAADDHLLVDQIRKSDLENLSLYREKHIQMEKAGIWFCRYASRSFAFPGYNAYAVIGIDENGYFGKNLFCIGPADHYDNFGHIRNDDGSLMELDPSAFGSIADFWSFLSRGKMEYAGASKKFLEQNPKLISIADPAIIKDLGI